MKTYVISPSELSYICNRCAYLGKNFNLYPHRIAAGVTQTLDGMEKDFFIGDAKKIDKSLNHGEVFDPFNISFFSKVLEDNKKRPFRLKGKGDAIIKFKDGSCGIIDYKTSKFKENNGKDYKKELGKKVLEYTPQLHGYSMLYSNLETDQKFLAENSRATKPDKIKESVRNTLSKIKTIEVKKTSLLGLVFIYPEKLLNEKNIIIDFSYRFEPVDYDIETFKGLITEFLDMLHNPKFPEATKDCGNCSYLINGGKLINEKYI